MAADTTPIISLGEFLRQERERKGVSLEQVASATKISVRILQALEADHFYELPAKPFIRGFVTSYARFIGLNAREILNQYDRFLDEKVQTRPNREAGHSGYAFERREGDQSRTFLWLIMGGFILVGGLVIFIVKPSLRHHRQSHADKLRALHPTASPSVSPEPSGLTPSSAPALAPAPVPTPTPSPTPSPLAKAATPKATPSPVPSPSATPLDRWNSGTSLDKAEVKYRAIIKAKEDFWIRYKVDERPQMRFRLKKDHSLVMKAKSSIRVQISDLNSATVFLSKDGAGVPVGEKTFALHQNTPTLIFPFENAVSEADPFAGQSPLPKIIPTPQPSVSPTPPSTP